MPTPCFLQPIVSGPRLAVTLLVTAAALILVPKNADAGAGLLEIDSKPGGAMVFVDGKRKGTTPETEGQKLTMELPEGDRVVELRKEGYETLKKTIFVGDNVIQPLTLALVREVFTNSLGMKFLSVPGTDTLFCIWETRVKDYAAYAAENPGVDERWKNPEYRGHKQMPDHPVVEVSWKDAKAFCAWLSKKDGVTYRLPTDHEWSAAVGIGDQEDAKASPGEKSKVIGRYPWGAAWPPPQGAGNFAKIDGYEDDYPFTAPVGSFSADRLGLHDLSGNVFEWCEDWYNPSDQEYRVLRGGSWFNATDIILRSSCRRGETPTYRDDYYGFRIVVEAGGVGG